VAGFESGSGLILKKSELVRVSKNTNFLCQMTQGDPPAIDPFGAQAMTFIAKLLKDESGATAIEYGLIAAGISVAIIAAVQGLGTQLKATFTSVSGALG
jgi:pilus assembly protein Flp/PilA